MSQERKNKEIQKEAGKGPPPKKNTMRPRFKLMPAVPVVAK